ncbi:MULTISPECIES: hypothetical protein [Colwellia]|uniref:Uncharacterized protein n=1 Tax=Colwellia marinimaniae TaxID=1513592 RepID=A0ABQ0MX72_9GAMM|nr:MULTISPECIES: hypothetical protein [Colwellia]GAW96847.1 hypothetical protein MTCD1_02470 [Colwellia marinimaniae]
MTLGIRPLKGVILVVGGPQKRGGRHRLFICQGVSHKQVLAVFRFNYSGAGDSEGELSTFTDIQSDIDAPYKPFNNAIVILLSWLMELIRCCLGHFTLS